MKIKKIAELYKNFGAGIAFSALAASRFRKMSPAKHRRILKCLKENYSDFIEKYRQKTNLPAKKEIQNENLPIWTLWWQGVDENLPDIVKICHASVRKNCVSHPFKVLTQENLSEYVKLPDYIHEKFDSGAITITHLSDIIRMYLIFNYGGMWLDSTIFINKIPRNVFEDEYYTVKRPASPKNRGIAQDRWTNFLFAAKPGNVLCGFVLEFFLEYWKTQKSLIDYFLADYAIAMAYDEIPECRGILDSVPFVNDEIYKLEDSLNLEFTPENFEKIKASSAFYKLAWRNKYREKTITGRQTIFGHLLEEAQK